MKPKSATPQESAQKPQSRLKWSLLGALLLALPVILFVLAQIWYTAYNQLFSPPPSYSYFAVFIGPLLLSPFTLVLGILVIIFAKRDTQKFIKFRRVSLWSVVILAVISFALFFVTSFFEGGRTPFNRPNYGITSAQAKVDIQQAFDVIISSGHLVWADGKPSLEKSQDVSLNHDWCTRWSYASNLTDDPTTDVDQSTIFSQVSSALNKIGWKAGMGKFDDGSGNYVSASKNNDSQDNGATIQLFFDSAANELNNADNNVHVDVESACFIE
ncbi:MAG: hypothetical protein JWN26_350 [Candidatus Saccharibacteria bacterium]|nr:hypothetical protein [Candidatus Saccharibacteria bacterium]